MTRTSLLLWEQNERVNRKELLTKATELVSVRCKYSNATANALLLYLFNSTKQLSCSARVQWATRSKRQRNNLLLVSCSCDWVVILASGHDLWPLCEKWHVAVGMHTSGEVCFIASLVKTSTLLITTRHINPQPVETAVRRRETPRRGCETIKRLMCWDVLAVFSGSVECSHPFTHSCRYSQYC